MLDQLKRTRPFLAEHSYYFLGLCAFAFSFLIRSPCSRCPIEYSDVYSLFFQVFGDSSRWFAGTVKAVGIPYVDYRFEYPPVVALIFYVTSAISTKVATSTGGPRPEAFYYVLVLAFVLPSYLAYLKAVGETSKILKARPLGQIFAAAGFGIAYYVVYNFDIIAIAFAMFSLLLLFRGRVRSSAFLLGLSVASKIITGVILFPSLLYLARKNFRSALVYSLFFCLAVVASFGPVFLFALRGLEGMINWHAMWYCENCFYVMVAPNIYDNIWKLVSLALMVVVPLAVMLVTRGADGREALISRSLLMVPAAISVSYVYSPQMNVMIAPAYLLISSYSTFGLLALSDFLNVLIMVFFFRANMLCDVLRIQQCPIVWGRESPIQWIAFSRILLLWAFIILTAARKRRRGLAVRRPTTDAGNSTKKVQHPSAEKISRTSLNQNTMSTY